MADISGGSLALLSTFSDTAQTLLSGAIHIASAKIDGTTYIYASSELDDAIEVFTLSEDGDLTSVGQITDTGGLALNRAWDMQTFQVDGNDFLAVAAAEDDGITLFSLTSSAPYLTFADSVFQSEDANYNLDLPFGLDVVTTSSGTFLYVAGYFSDGISSFEVQSNGTLVPLENVDDDATFAIGGATDITAFEPGFLQYIAVAGYDDDGVTVFRVLSDGSLFHRDSIAGLTSANGVWEIDVTVIENTAYFYLPGTGSSSISVVSFDGNSLSEIQSVTSSSGLALVRASKVIDVGDQKFLAVLEDVGADLQLFRIETNGLTGNQGQLTFVQTVSGPTFGGSGDVQTVTFDDQTFLIASTKNGTINVLEVGGGDDVLNGTQESDDIFGFGGDDIIYALAGNDTIDGGTGDDVVFAGSGIDHVFASFGNDQLNGGSGFDRLDMSFFDGATNGVTVDMFGERIILPGGFVQFGTNFERIDGTSQNDSLIGNEKNNDLRGGLGDDTLRGREGDDFLRGSNGDDFMIGADGDDNLYGGNGADLLNGGLDSDNLYGGANDDQMFGSFGNDGLEGGDGADIMRGNEGEDTLFGGSGDDDIRGGDGGDYLFGDSENNYLSGDAGDDFLASGSGNDVMLGGADEDTFFFAQVASGGGGFNNIRDFTDGEDVIDVSDYVFGDASDVLALASQRSWGVRIDLADGQTIALDGFNLGNLDATDFYIAPLWVV